MEHIATYYFFLFSFLRWGIEENWNYAKRWVFPLSSSNIDRGGGVCRLASCAEAPGWRLCVYSFFLGLSMEVSAAQRAP
jgi:hypothetical protein